MKLAFSTCPNDTFMFAALVNKLIPHSYDFELILEDIKDLNQLAANRQVDICKVSFNAYTRLQGWQLLDSGAALGRGVVPLLVAKTPINRPSEARIAIPGADTTANLLMQFYAPEAKNKEVVLFSEIMPAVANGDYDAGVIIHESRFTYQEHGLVCLQDLGDYWEQQTQLPIPLGGIVAQSKLGPEVIADFERLLRESIRYAWENPEAVIPYVRQHAQEMEEVVMWRHIRLYVNEFSEGLGEEGRKAVSKLKEIAAI